MAAAAHGSGGTVSTKARHNADATCTLEVAAAVIRDVPNKVYTVCSNDQQNMVLCLCAPTRAICAGDCCEHWLAGHALHLFCWYGWWPLKGSKSI